MTRTRIPHALGMLAIMIGAAASCSSAPDDGGLTLGSGDGDGSGQDGDLDGIDNGGQGSEGENEEPTVLDERVVSYGEALRTASIKIRDVIPTLAEVKRLENAEDPRAEYEALIDEMFADPRYPRRMIRWWRDTLRQGGGDLDTAPVFAARVMVEGRSYKELFTASSGTCPTYDADAEAFVDGDCNNGVATHAGVLTNPGSMAQFYGNMAIRRVRWVQEIFDCTKFPAEYAETPEQVGDAQYTAPWPWDALPTEPIDFLDTSSVVCANCHATINRIAPLFGNFDEDGQYQNQVSVMTPIAPDPVTTELDHWLNPGEVTAWRVGAEVATLPELGQALADDPGVSACLAARLWNFTLSKEDIVGSLTTVPIEVLEPYLILLAESGDLTEAFRAMFKGEDFVSY